MKPILSCPRSDVVAQALQAVLDYLWNDEATDYRAHSPQAKRGHIFAELKTLQALVVGVEENA